MAQRQHLHCDADLHATRARRHGAGEDKRRGGDRPLGRKVQFSEPDRIEAPALGGVGLRKGLSECVGVGLCWVARKFLKETKFECHADAHPWALLARLTPAVRRDGGLWKWACGVVSCWPAQWRPARMDGR